MTGWSGPKTVIAPPAPRRISATLLQTGHPMARNTPKLAAVPSVVPGGRGSSPASKGQRRWQPAALGCATADAGGGAA